LDQEVIIAGGVVEEDPDNRNSIKVGMNLTLPALTQEKITLQFELLVYYCHDLDKVCKRSCVLITQPLLIMP
jgi:hypothetical protein